MERNEKYFKAKRRIREITAFYQHFAIYIFAMMLAFIVDLFDGSNWWCYYPATGWGIFVAFNAFSILFHAIFNPDWKDTGIQELAGSKQ